MKRTSSYSHEIDISMHDSCVINCLALTRLLAEGLHKDMHARQYQGYKFWVTEFVKLMRKTFHEV
jgi:hypothetical protein